MRILHHRQLARFPDISDGGSELLLGEQECAFAPLGRQRATANIPVEGRVRGALSVFQCLKLAIALA